MNIKGASNFRHIGGYIGHDGRPVVDCRIFRSDHLGALDADDVARVAALGVRRVIDFRGVNERETAPCVLTDVTVHSLSIEPTIVQVLRDLIAAGNKLSAQDVVAHMQETYRGLVRRNSHRFAALFAHLLESDEPTVVHCTVGKDRTGFACAMILSSLGVSQQDVMRDYLLTNERVTQPRTIREGLTPEAASVLWRVRPEFLEAAMDAVQRDYGGLDAYLREGLGLGEAQLRRMRELYLVPATA